MTAQSAEPTGLTCKAVLFDMDGVLVDSTEVVERSWRKWAKAQGIDEGHLMQVIHGRKALESIELVAPHLDAHAEWQTLIRQEMEDIEGLKVFEGAAALLAALPPSAWTIVTSAPRVIAVDRLERLGLPVPPALICAEDVTKGKPAPESYLAGAEALGMAPSDCLVVEDAPSGVKAGLRAGMQVLAIASTFAADKLQEATACAADIGDVRAVVRADGTLKIQVNSIRS